MIKIGLVITSLHFGGAERIFSDLSRFLNDSGYEVHFFLIDDSNIECDYRGQIHRISFFGRMNSAFSSLFTLQHLILLLYYKLKIKPDITISAFEFLNTLNLLTGSSGNTIVTMHNHRFQHEIIPSFKNKLIERCFSRLVNRAGKVISVSETIRQKCLSLYNIQPSKAITIYNSFYTEGIKEKSRLPLPDFINNFITENTFVCVGRFVEQKAFHKVIIAFSEIVSQCKTAKLILIGDGLLRSHLQELISKFHLDDSVLITGFLSNPYNVVAKAKAFILSSYFEGYGNVIVESMICGTCVISTDCLCGPREIISPSSKRPETLSCIEPGEFGILIPTHDGSENLNHDKCTECIVEAVLLLINDKRLCSDYTQAALRRAADFDIKKNYTQWLNIIDELCPGSKNKQRGG